MLSFFSFVCLNLWRIWHMSSRYFIFVICFLCCSKKLWIVSAFLMCFLPFMCDFAFLSHIWKFSSFLVFCTMCNLFIIFTFQSSWILNILKPIFLKICLFCTHLYIFILVYLHRNNKYAIKSQIRKLVADCQIKKIDAIVSSVSQQYKKYEI